MNSFKDNITDPDFWLRLLYTLLFAVAWQVVELLLAVILVVQILFRLFTGKPHADLAGLGNSLSQYAWQMGRYVTGASDLKPWPFIEWPAADAEWQPRPAEGPVTVDPAAAPSAPVPPASAVAPVPPAAVADPTVSASPSPEARADEVIAVEPDAPVLHPADEVGQPEPPTVRPIDDDVLDVDANPDGRPTP